MTAGELRALLAEIVAEPVSGEVVYGDDVLDVLDRRRCRPPSWCRSFWAQPGHTAHQAKCASTGMRTGELPGGRIDAEDADAEAAALREAEEEIALDPARVEVLGRMADYVTGTGYRITPVLGLLPPGLSLRPAPDEVESLFELPIGVLLDPDAPQRETPSRRGIWREYWVWPHPDHYIWGATAAILVHLAQKLRAAGPHAAPG